MGPTYKTGASCKSALSFPMAMNYPISGDYRLATGIAANMIHAQPL